MMLAAWTTVLSAVSTSFFAYTTSAEVSLGPWTRSQGWGPWSEWSLCSSTCDPELAVRVRDCRSPLNVIPDNTQVQSRPCNGTEKQYRVCDKQDCRGVRTDYRKYECQKQNYKPFRGKRYSWEPYINPYDQCIVTCKAKYYGFYTGFGRPVRDGLLCTSRRKDYVCLQGKCEHVGCDGVVGSRARKDYCGVCGGDNTSCRIISGIYTRTHLKYGYNTITRIPAGACSVNITEMARSRNYLVLKFSNGTALINGRRHLSRTGDYPGAGTVVKYDKASGPRCPGQCILAEGPLTEALELQVLSYRRNPGIKYMFTIPVDMIDSVMQTFIPKSPTETGTTASRAHNNGRHGHRSRHNSQSANPSARTNPDDQSTGRIRFGERPQYVPPDNTDTYQPLQTGRKHHGTQDAINRYRTKYYQGALENEIDKEKTDSQSQRTGYQTYNREYPQTGAYGTRSRYQTGDRSLYQAVSGSRGQTTAKREPNLRISNTIDRINFYWRITGFTECSKTCGGGDQETKVACMKREANVVVTDENCDPAEKPENTIVTCNTTPCPPGWQSSEWSECSQSCGQGMQTRRVECKQTISPEVVIPVSASSCELGARPVSSQSCRVRPCAEWNVGEWSECSVRCSVGQKTRSVTCQDTGGQQVSDRQCEGIKPGDEQSCDMGACAQGWYHTEWSEECSTTCGEGYHTREAYCSAEDGSPLAESKCDGDKPRMRKKCKKNRPCGGNWFAGPWAPCAATCGEASRARDVVCMKKLGADLFTIVDEENCAGKEKPGALEPCPELPPCPSQWFMTGWSECSKSCGTGTKTRDLKCLDPDLGPSSECKSGRKPSRRHTCNTMSCDRPQLDEEPGCRDKWGRCKLVVQARLCSYKYYRDQCCNSCRLHHLQHQKQRQRGHH